MDRTIEHSQHNDNLITAEGGTLDEQTNFYREQSVLTYGHTLFLPANNGLYIFEKDEQDSIPVELAQVENFYIGGVFHLPNELNPEDDMKELIEENGLVLLIDLHAEDGEQYHLHYVLEEEYNTKIFDINNHL